MMTMEKEAALEAAMTELDDIGKLQSPTKWHYDTTLSYLTMVFRDGLSTYILKGKATLGETNGFFRIATMTESGVKYALWTDARTHKPL